MYITYLIFLILIIFVLATIYTNYKDYPLYSKVYKTLPTLKWYYIQDVLSSGDISNYQPDEVEYWMNNGDIRLCDHVWLFAHPMDMLDPYSLYWYLKYRRWFKQYIKNHPPK